ncbi:MAG TPA: GNAT family N-acetyltransferase [Candidatus Angelobacter sp.]|jgi:ribosomal protein S18 acetylase RimI-like enzyme
MPPTLRAVRADDHEFLFRLYASTRLHEIAAFGWPEAQQQAFLRMQFNAQQQWYKMSYEQAEHQIIEHEGASIGRLMVLRKPDSVLLVDIALLPEFRGQGIGGDMIRELIQQCNQQKLPLRLQVLRLNPAQRLYERLGFKTTAEDQMYLQMEKQPS